MEEFDAVPVALRQCAEEFGALDIVIVNAGVDFSARIGERREGDANHG